MAGFAFPVEKIATLLGIERTTLWRKYSVELERGRTTLEAKLASNLLKIANGNDNVALKAIIFALQARFDWRFPAGTAELLGKKEAAQQAAETAGQDSDWGDDLRRPN